MDDFEKEYFESLKSLSNNYKKRRRELALSRIKMFAASLCRQLLENKEIFDVILSAGNSGLFMNVIAKMVYEELHMKYPHNATIPLYRFDDIKNIQSIANNSSLRGYIRKNISHISEKPNVLFIDDEIMQALTVKNTLELFLYDFPHIDTARCVILAENHFFEWHYNMPKVSVNFFAYARLIQGLNGNIGYFISDDLFTKLNMMLPEVQSYNHAMALVIGGGLKKKNKNNIPFFDTSLDDYCSKNVKDYRKRQEQLLLELKHVVQEGVSEYKENKIRFRF